MKVKKFVTGPIDVNTYIVYDEISRDGFIIDVGGSAKFIAEFVVQNNLNIKGIYCTHGHFDHILGAKELQEILKLDLFVNKEDEEFVANLDVQLEFFGMPDASLPPVINGYVDENTEIVIGKDTVKVIETPGHTRGGVCYLVAGMLFSGDTLFLESIGRTDLPGGDYGQIKSSIHEKLFVLDDNVVVYPGHGEATDIGHEKKYNLEV